MTHPRPNLTIEEIWRKYDQMEARRTAPLSERMLDLAGVAAGKRVLDLATGRGEPAIAAAHRGRVHRIGARCRCLGKHARDGECEGRA